MKKTVTIIIATMIALTSAFAADQKPKKQKAELKEVVYQVHLHCENCVAKVTDNLSRAKGVKDLDVCLGHQTVGIKYDPAKTSEETLKATIEKLGYPVKGKVQAGHDHDQHGHEHQAHDHDHNHKH
jgi:copper chaperone CopZ